jgi:putative ABC transport system substrate-binding protein
MRRREFIALASGAGVAWVVSARAQPAMPVIGFLNPTSPEANVGRLRAFRQGLKETGYVEGENLTIEYRWADGDNARLPELAEELVRRKVSVIAAVGSSTLARTVKAATTTIPGVFAVGEDPVKLGLVGSLSRPGGNLTGINIFNSELISKRLALLREFVPSAARVSLLVNPSDRSNTETNVRDVEAAATTMQMKVRVHHASSSSEIDTAFATLTREGSDALFVAGDLFFNSRRSQLTMLAARHAIPATYGSRDYPDYGGLMSYGSNLTDVFHRAGLYVGRILKGAKPADMPIVQADKFELVINAQTARMLGLPVPPSLLARADVVIE